MPQLQALQAIPSFQEELGRALGTGVQQGLSGLFEQYYKGKEKQQLAAQFEKAGINPAFAHLDPQIVKELMKQEQKNKFLQSIFPSLAGGQTGQRQPIPETSQQMLGGEQPQFSPEQILAAETQLPGLGRIMQSQEKLREQKVAPIKQRNLTIFDEANTNLRALEEEDIGLERLQKLSDKIGEKEAGGQNFFERLGKTFRFDPGTGGFSRIGKATSTPEEENYIKLISDQTKNIKNDYGARITNFDMEIFLRRFPDLMMTPDGRKQILETLRDYKEAKKLYNKTTKDFIKQSKGMIDPYELDGLVENQIRPQLDQIKNRMVNRGFSKGSELPEQYKEGDTASNDQGQRLIFKGGQWQPL